MTPCWAPSLGQGFRAGFVDQGANQLQVVQAYGGSDRVAPSFNRMQYVRFGHIHGPKDLGTFSSADLLVRGEVGSESGTATFFFHFALEETARVGIQVYEVTPRTAQYIQYALRRVDGPWLDITEYGVETWEEGEATTVIEELNQTAGTPEGNRYVELSTSTGLPYWDINYAEGDDGTPPSTSQTVRVIRNEIEIAYPVAGAIEPGSYMLTVSCSQWPQIPFLFRLLVRPAATKAGDATVELEPSGRLSLVKISGEATVDVDGEGRIVQTFNLAGEATVTLSPKTSVQVTSPYS